MKKIGAFVGKFYPPHKGHAWVVDTLINELEKLCLFVGTDGVITKEVVDKICSRSVEASIYNLSKMLLRGDLQGAYKSLDDLLYMNTEPALLINILSSSYIDIYRAFAARKSGVNPESVGKDLGYLDSRKIAAIFCKAIIQKKAFSFDLDVAQKQLKKKCYFVSLFLS